MTPETVDRLYALYQEHADPQASLLKPTLPLRMDGWLRLSVVDHLQLIYRGQELGLANETIRRLLGGPVSYVLSFKAALANAPEEA